MLADHDELRLPDTCAPGPVELVAHALADGLQTHWLREPDVDMAGTIEALFAALEPRPVAAR